MSNNMCRIRRTLVHPNGKYVYLAMEYANVVQVYEIDNKGKISGDCLQEVPTIDEGYFRRGYFGANNKWHGLAVNGLAELHVTETELMVSNRCMTAPHIGSGETSIRIFDIGDDGAKLVLKQVLETMGLVRHFRKSKDSTKVYSGINTGNLKVIETFVRDSPQDNFRKVGEANIEMDVMCIVPM